MILQNLTTNSYYEVKVAAITFSVINPKKIVLGKFSEPRIVSIDMHKHAQMCTDTRQVSVRGVAGHKDAYEWS